MRVAELVDRPLVVDHQPDEVRRVEVEAEVVARDGREHLAPDRRRPGEVVAARPLVVGEDHRAVLDRDLHAALAGVRRRAAARSSGSARRFSGSGRSLSLPTNVPTTSTPSRCAASITLRRWPLTCLARARRRGGGCSGSRRATEIVRPAPVHRRRARRPASKRLDVDVRDARVARAARRPRRASRRSRAPGSRSPAAQSATSRGSVSGNAAVSRPSFTASPPPIVGPRFGDAAIASPSTFSPCPSANVG